MHNGAVGGFEEGAEGGYGFLATAWGEGKVWLGRIFSFLPFFFWLPLGVRPLPTYSAYSPKSISLHVAPIIELAFDECSFD